MRTIRTTTISILAVGLLAGTTVGVAAQDDEAADPMAPSFFAVEYVAGDDFDHVQGTIEEVGPGLEKDYGGVTTGLVVEAEDPRASGAWSRVQNNDLMILEERADGPHVTSLGARSVRVTNDAGWWEGTGHSAANFPASPTEDPTVVMFSVLKGNGAYEGLTLILADTAPGNSGWGWIAPSSSVPPIPEPYAAE